MKKFLVIAAVLMVAAFGCRQRGSAPAAAEASQVDFPDTLAAAEAAKKLPEEPVFDIVTNLGTIKVRLYKDTPRHKANFTKLALAGYYDSLLFHRVINGFMIQGGDPYTRDTSKIDMWGMGGPNYTIQAEMRDADGNPLHRHKKGALAAARRGDVANPYKESSGSQFYIVQNADACIHLDGEYTVFGETVAGLNVIDRIATVKTDRLDRPVSDVIIISIRPDQELNKIELEKESAGTEFAVKTTE